MAKRDTSNLLDRTTKAGAKLSAKDRQVDSRRAEERGELNTASLNSIRNRNVDTRPLTMTHVWTLVESIAVLGLIEPLVVDQDKVLLAGGHRLEAIKRLREEHKYAKAYAEHFPDDQVPVRIMPFVAAAEPERALQVEVAENEQRRDYTPAEVRRLAERLMDAGFERLSGGRPKNNQKFLIPILSSVVGKNRRTIQRYLDNIDNKGANIDIDTYLKKAKKSLETWQEKAPNGHGSGQLRQRLPEILELLKLAISDGDT